MERFHGQVRTANQHTSGVTNDAASRAEVKRIDAGGVMQPDGARAFGSSRTGVVVIDLKTLEVVGRIDVGPNPDGVTWTSHP